jgi:hypothetical protein
MITSNRSLFIVSILSLCAAAQAGTIELNSQAGLANSLTPETVAITPHSLWQTNNPVNPMNSEDTSAVWISYAPTGYNDSSFQSYSSTSPVVSIFHDFTSGPGYLRLNVWADDTAEVLLDGNQIYAPIFTQSTCSGQPIGCLPEDMGSIYAQFSGGSHRLEFRLFQVGTGGDSGSNPFGLLYTGGAFSEFQSQVSQTPEPATWILGGSCLLAGAIIQHLRRRSQTAAAEPARIPESRDSR